MIGRLALAHARVPLVPIVLLAVAIGYASARSPLLTLAAAGVLVLLALAVLQTEALLLVLAAAMPWEDALAYPSKSVSVVKLLGLLVTVGWVFRALLRNDRVRAPAVSLPVLALGVAVGCSLLFSPDPAGSLVTVLRYVLFILFFFLVIQLVRDRRDVLRLVRVSVVSAAAAAGWALYQYAFAHATHLVSGPISDPNDFAYVLASLLPLAAVLWVSDRRARLLWTVAIAMLAVALLATLSRGALVGLAAMVLWAVASRRIPLGRAVLSLTAVACVVGLAFLVWAPVINHSLESKNRIADQNVTSRLAFWDGAVRMAEDHPFTGVGPGRFGAEAPTYVRNNPIPLQNPVAHNSYLEILAESGVVALLAFVAFLATVWRLLVATHRVEQRRGDALGARLATGMQASMVVAVVSGAFLSEQLRTPFWLIGALAVAVAAPGGRRAAAERPAVASRAAPA